jgi:hypothetical protein
LDIRAVLGLDLVVAEVDDVRHPEDALVELHPVVHAAELDVADHVIERLQPHARVGIAVFGHRDVAGKVRAGVLAAVDEGVDHVAVGADRGELDAAEVVFEPVRLGDHARAALNRLAVGLGGARHLEADALRCIAVPARVLRDLAVVAQAARHEQADVALLEHIGGPVPDACLGTRVGRTGEAEGVLVEVGRLLGVADPQLDVIPTVERHEVGVTHPSDLTAAC